MTPPPDLRPLVLLGIVVTVWLLGAYVLLELLEPGRPSSYVR